MIPGSALSRYIKPEAAVIEYIVTEALTAIVEKIEFLNAANQVLTSAPVYVPISGNTRFKHQIHVKEGI